MNVCSRFLLLLVVLLPGLPLRAQSRPAAAPVVAPASFFGSYAYLTYTILDKGTSADPLPAQGVGGTLLLRPDGTYQKRLIMTVNGGPMHFDQDGRFTFTPGRISFTYPDKSGRPRTDEGTFQLTKNQLTITLAGFPVGNQSSYTLRRN